MTNFWEEVMKVEVELSTGYVLQVQAKDIYSIDEVIVIDPREGMPYLIEASHTKSISVDGEHFKWGTI